MNKVIRSGCDVACSKNSLVGGPHIKAETNPGGIVWLDGGDFGIYTDRNIREL